LAGFRGAAADELALRMLDDDDPHVRAAVATQLRERHLPGATMRLVRLLESPHQIEREAAQAGLVEFQFDKYLAGFDGLSADSRRSTGLLVRQIDPALASNLRREFSASAP